MACRRAGHGDPAGEDKILPLNAVPALSVLRQVEVGPLPNPCGGLFTSIFRPCFCATALGGFGKRDCQNAILELSRDLIGLDLVGDGDRPLERAVRTFGSGAQHGPVLPLCFRARIASHL